jgi:hypothetical protein
MILVTPPGVTSGAMPTVTASASRARGGVGRHGAQMGSAPISRAAAVPVAGVTLAGYREPYEIRLADQLVTVGSSPFYVDQERVGAAVAGILAAVPGSTITIPPSAQ